MMARARLLWLLAPAAVGAILLAPLYPAPAQTSPSSATTAPENIDAALQAQLTEIDHRAGQVKNLTAKFVQKKFTALMNKPLVSSGQVRSAGPVIRWDTHAPQASVLYTDGKELRLYYPSQKLEEIYPIDQRLSDLLASPVPRLKAVRDHFQISRADNSVIAELLGPGARPGDSQPIALRLTPIDPALKQHVREVTVLIDPRTGLALAVQTTDSDGDTTNMTFADPRLDSGLKPDELALVVPPGTTISHPLQGASPADSPSGAR